MEELQWNGSFSIMAGVSGQQPRTSFLLHSLPSECCPFSQGLLAPGSKGHKMLMLISSEFLKKKVFLSTNLRESRLTLENEENFDSEIFEEADFSTFNSVAK